MPIFLLISTVFVARELWDDMCLVKSLCVTDELIEGTDKIHLKSAGSKPSFSHSPEDEGGSTVTRSHMTMQQQDHETPVKLPKRVDTEQSIGMGPVAQTDSLTLPRRRTGTIEIT